ncbi:DUF6584 family protein [Cognatiyoonia sp. IB215182]|nr:DUF6584 family protein [Cognatiyoonia sp. IB215182]
MRAAILVQMMSEIASHPPRIDLSRPTKVPRQRDLVAPLLTHGVTGAAWAVAGFWVLQAFNTSILGFIGALMLLWAGFKALILLVIYGAALYALTLRQDMFRFVAERRHIARINTRITRDLEAGKVERAMDRLHGLISCYPDNMGLRRRLGIYLMEGGRHAEAGRFLILHPAPTEEERGAIRAFYHANGDDPFQILRKSIKGVSGAGLSKASQRVLLQLYAQVHRDADQRSWVYRAVGAYLHHVMPAPRVAFWREHKDLILEVAVFCVVVAFFFVMSRGL